LHNSGGVDLVSKSMIDEFSIDDVNLSATENTAQFVFEIDDIPAGRPARIVLDQHIDITIGAEFVAKNRTE